MHPVGKLMSHDNQADKIMGFTYTPDLNLQFLNLKILANASWRIYFCVLFLFCRIE